MRRAFALLACAVALIAIPSSHELLSGTSSSSTTMDICHGGMVRTLANATAMAHLNNHAGDCTDPDMVITGEIRKGFRVFKTCECN